MRKPVNHTYIWEVREVRDEAPQVRSLILESVGKRPPFISGQYLTIRLPGLEPLEGKSYSISSSEEEEMVRITVKAIGSFSNALCALSEGDRVTTGAPYGFFYPDPTIENDLIFIAGGIGITPCMSIIEQICSEGHPGNIFLFYSNRTAADIVFRNELDQLQKKCTRFTAAYHVTRETSPDLTLHPGRMTGVGVRQTVPNPERSDYFVCGSIEFTKSMWKELREAGIPSTQIYTEGFF